MMHQHSPTQETSVKYLVYITNIQEESKGIANDA